MIGQVVGGYLITRKIGGGGMGAVYYGEHKTLGRPAAIKVLLPQFSGNPEVLNRFFNEARATGMIRHAGLIDIFDYGSLPSGEAYLVMEYLDGETLASRIRRDRRLTTELAFHIMRQIAQATAAAHTKGIIHRDLKPDNIYLVYDEDVALGVRTKVLDFGVAKLTDHGGEMSAFQTNLSAMIGTPRYMSPEQCQGAGKVDPRSDIYSLGCIAYEMACGRTPFTGDVASLMIGHLREEPPPPRTINPDVPKHFNDIILWMLNKEMEHRPRSMTELVAAIDAHIQRPTHEHSTAVRLPQPSGPSVEVPSRPTDPHGHQTIVADPGNTTALVRPITTLSGSASEKTPAPTSNPTFHTPPSEAKPARGVGFYASIAGGLVIVVGVTALAVARTGRHTETPPATVATAPSAPTAPASAPAPSTPARSKLRITSNPTGASVYRAGSSQRLGTTPFVEEVDAGAGIQRYQIKLAGYRDESLEVAPKQDADVAGSVKLQPLEVAPKAEPVAAPVKPEPVAKEPTPAPVAVAPKPAAEPTPAKAKPAAKPAPKPAAKSKGHPKSSSTWMIP